MEYVSDFFGLLARPMFTEDHEMFRKSFARFLEAEVVPHYDRWEAQGHVDKDAYRKAGAAGFLGPGLPVEYGGAGADILYSVVMIEEMVKANTPGVFYTLHSDIVAPYINRYGTEEQKRRFLPGMCSGELIGAIAMTEPDGGTDLQSIRSSAVRSGDHYILNGRKTFISNGTIADILVVAAKTDTSAGHAGISLFILEAGMEGFTRGKPLRKIGMHAQDTAELFFDDVRIPAENRLGEEGRGFPMLMTELAWERLQAAVGSIQLAECAVSWTTEYVKGRKAFGKTLFDFQNSRIKLAECATAAISGRAFVDSCLTQHMTSGLDPAVAAAAKYLTSDTAKRVVDECLQLHGGYGYMAEYRIAQAYVNNRYQPMAAGANEVMKELVARKL